MMVLRSMVVWFVFILLEVVNGTLRIAWLQPWLGEARAETVSFVTGSILVVAIATLFMPWVRPSRLAQLFEIGILWMGLTVIFEVALGRIVFAYSWHQIVSQFNILTHVFMPLELVVLLLAPFVAAKLRNITLRTQPTI
jgi:hypothetical protein